ncbi:MAG: hypothetical protein WC348_02330 [Patescibacteria group bacterium]|jgi:hypothetical protein
MGLENLLSGVELANQLREDPQINARMDRIANNLIEKGTSVNPFILKDFEDPNFFNSLPAEIRDSDQKLSELLDNSGKFNDIIHLERERRWDNDTSGLLGEKVDIAETTHAEGRTRRAESGYKINVDYLKTKGIDPSKILFFRATQPSDTPKPEYYWTSDYFETQRGLTVEISAEQRKTAIILVADLETISRNGGLIQDVNDDNGLPVRQIGTAGFDQSLAIAKIKPQI